MSATATQTIAAFAASTTWEDIPVDVRHEAKRSLLNYFATAIAGSGESAVEKSLAVLAPFSGPAQCSVIGRPERVDLPLAAYVNGMSANIFDFDDTHQQTVIHPTAPVAPALFAYAETRRCEGKSLLRAFVLGGEIECRIGNAVSPSHYARGWHITSTCGVFGSAAGIGNLIGLTEDQHTWAIGHAAAQAAGLVGTLGTMSKSISVGNAARNGILSALLADEGFSGPADPLGAEHGFLQVFSDRPAIDRLAKGLGDDWEIAKNTYKPYPAGIVLHPVIEGCIKLYHDADLRSEDVAEIKLTSHPLLRVRADRPDVTTGRASQVSVQHAIAIALRRGMAGLQEFDDEAVWETQRDGIRPNVTFIDDEDRDIETVLMELRTRQGQVHKMEIATAKGGPSNPMTDAELEDKLAELANYRGFNRDIRAISDAVWSLEDAPDAGEVMRLVNTPE